MTLIIDPLVAVAGLIFGLFATLYSIRQRVPSSRRLRPWPGRGGIPGKGDGLYRAIRGALPSAPSGVQRIDHNRCHEAFCVAEGRCSCHRNPPKGGSACPADVVCHHTFVCPTVRSD